MKAANLEERAALSALALDFRRRWKKSSVPSTYAICGWQHGELGEAGIRGRRGAAAICW